MFAIYTVIKPALSVHHECFMYAFSCKQGITDRTFGLISDSYCIPRPIFHDLLRSSPHATGADNFGLKGL